MTLGSESGERGGGAGLRGGMFCPVCEYDLRSVGRCPECGTEIAERGVASQIPWLHRRQIGRVNAYVRTVGKVVFRPRKFYAEAGARIRRRDLRGFSSGAGVDWDGNWDGVYCDCCRQSRNSITRPTKCWTVDIDCPAVCVGGSVVGNFSSDPGVHLAIRMSMALYRLAVAGGPAAQRPHRRVTYLGFASSAVVPIEAAVG